MTITFDAHALAVRLIEAREGGVQVAIAASDSLPQRVEDAYAVQAMVMRALGPTGGFKTSRPDPRLPNVMAPIPEAQILSSPAHYTGIDMRLCGIELEIGFRIDHDLPRPGEADYDERLRAAVSAVPAIEMVDTRLADHDNVSDLIKLTDNQFGFGLVVGQPVKDFRDLELSHPDIAFSVNGAPIGSTRGQVPGAVDAFQVFKDFLDVVGDHCGGLKLGMYVTTGALSGLFWTEKDIAVEGSIAGLGDVRVTVGDA